MPPTEYHLYRAKFIKSNQSRLFDPEITARQIFKRTLEERPALGLRKSHVWHIGNVEYLTSSGGRFAIGRTSTATVGKYDPDSGDFMEHLDDLGPYTFVYFDMKIGLLGIGKRTKVAPNVQSIARRIQKLFSRTRVVLEHQIEVRIDLIPDPRSFLEKIYSAYAIRRFRANFTGPNPVDADEIFQKPMSYYCQELGAVRGSVSVSGESLDEDAIAAVTKSTAATANTASALIQPSYGSQPVPISLNAKAKVVLVDPTIDPSPTLELIQDAYKGVRE